MRTGNGSCEEGVGAFIQVFSLCNVISSELPARGIRESFLSLLASYVVTLRREWTKSDRTTLYKYSACSGELIVLRCANNQWGLCGGDGGVETIKAPVFPSPTSGS